MKPPAGPLARLWAHASHVPQYIPTPSPTNLVNIRLAPGKSASFQIMTEATYIRDPAMDAPISATIDNARAVGEMVMIAHAPEAPHDTLPAGGS
jgi:hypothetical protein